MVNGCRQQADRGLKGWLAGGIRVAAAWDKSFGAAEGISHGLTIAQLQCTLKCREVVVLFFLDVFEQVLHESVEGWYQLWV